MLKEGWRRVKCHGENFDLEPYVNFSAINRDANLREGKGWVRATKELSFILNLTEYEFPGGYQSRDWD